MTEYARAIDVGLFRPYKYGRVFDFFDSLWSHEKGGLVFLGIILIGVIGASNALPNTPLGNQEPKQKAPVVVPIEPDERGNDNINSPDNSSSEQDIFRSGVRLVLFENYLDSFFNQFSATSSNAFDITLAQGFSRPLPEPFECVAPEVSSCIEPPNTLNPPGYTQANCIPIDPTCAQGTCFGICAGIDGTTYIDPTAAAETVYEYSEGNIVGLVANPIVALLNLESTQNAAGIEAQYCAYAVVDRCGGDGGGCAFVLECEQKRVCESDACVLKPGRNLVDDEISCESNADCRTSYNTCLGSQCVSVSGAGEDECGIAGSLACPQCVREIVDILDDSENVIGTEEICERPVVQQACVTKDNASLYYLKSSPTDKGDITRRERLWTEIPLEEYLIDNPYFGTTLEEDGGGQCAQVTCIDENEDGEITWNIPREPNECAPPAQWCSNETECGISEIIGVEPPTNIGSPPSILCGDGVCSAGEESTCRVDCVLRQDALPPFPARGDIFGDVVPVSTCGDTTGDGNFDSCVLGGGGSTTLCGEDADCTREFRSTCQGQSCILLSGPGINSCGAPTDITDVTALDDDQCIADVTRICPGDPPINNPLGLNLGNPSCDFSMDAAFSYLRGIDCQYANFWMGVISGESGFNANAYNGDSTSGSAWGLLQMGHEAYPDATPPISRQMNSVYDRGDVPWRDQLSNAVNYNNGLRNGSGRTWCYWSVARNLVPGLDAACRAGGAHGIEPNSVSWPPSC